MIIYTITNTVNGKKYVGQTIFSLEKRIAAHKNTAKTKNYPLYRAFKKYGLNLFLIEQIDAAITKESLDEKEKFWIKEFDTVVPNGYNVQSGGEGGSIPGTMSDKGRRRIGEAARKRMTGRIVSRETREKLRQNATGIVFTEERKHRISEANKGKSRNKGHIMSEKTKAKISAAHKGLPIWNKGKTLGPLLEKTKAKISAALKGKYKGKPSPLKGRIIGPYSEERKQKMRGKPSPLRGRKFGPLSEERKAKISAALAGKNRGPYKTSITKPLCHKF
jgi:group I intron endonuclease